MEFGKIWRLIPGDGVFSETWRPGKLLITKERLLWYSFFDEALNLQIPLSKIADIKFMPGEDYSAKGKNILAITYKNPAMKAAYFSKRFGKEFQLQELKSLLNNSIKS